MADKQKIKLKTNKETTDLDVITASVMKGGVLELVTEDEHGTRTTRLLSPQTWEEIEIK